MSQGATAPQTQPVPPPSRSPSRRWWFPIATIVLVAIVLAAITRLPPDRFDSGMRTIFSFIATVAGCVAIGCWFFFMAGLSSRTRLACAAAVLVLAGVAVGATRRVEFSGDMVPTFDFRWMPDREAVLEDYHRSEQLDGQPPVVFRPSEDNVLEFRGPRRDGVSPGPALARDWSREEPKLVWRHPVGGGYAAFVVVEPLAITIEQRRDREAIVAYDVDTGRERWVHDYPALFHETLGGDGPRATPTVSEDKVYSLGATGMPVCLDLATGKPRWSVNILEENKVANLEWAMSGSPLVYDGLVVVNPGDQKGAATSRALLAFDAATGRPAIWRRRREGQLRLADAGHARRRATGSRLRRGGPGGLRRHGRSRVVAVSLEERFRHQRCAARGGGRRPGADHVANRRRAVKLAQAEGRWTAEAQWTSRKLKASYASPIIYKNHVYGIDENILACIELASGRQVWKDRNGQYGHGQILLRGDLLVVQAESGQLALVEATPERFHECAIIQAIDGKTWNNPTLFGRSVLVRNHLEMARYDLPTE